MPSYLSDTPIKTSADDLYGVKTFAQSVAKGILGTEKTVGTVIALNGPWGTGKSSIVNLIREEIEKAADTPISIAEFKCWWFRGEDALILAFLQHIDGLLRDSFGEKAVRGLIRNVCRPLLQATPAFAPVVAAASGHQWIKFVGDGAKWLDHSFFDGDSVEKAFEKVAKLLESKNKRFLVIIDDIDRLTPEEALAVFRLIKSVGHLPMITYLVVFDRELAEKAVQQRYPSEGPHFLEKIIQASFEVPTPLKSDLNKAILQSIEEICGKIDPRQVRRIMNIFHDVISPYVTSPRHVARFKGAISVTWPAIGNEVNIADFLALETIHLYEPTLFKAIGQRKHKLCGLRTDGENRSARNEERFDPYLAGIPESRKEQVKLALQRLFPRLEHTRYADGFLPQWDAERRVCVEKHLETYLRLTLSDETLSSTMIDDLVRRAGDQEFIKQTFRDASKTLRKGGSSMVPVYLDELNTHARRVERADVQPLLKALFEIHDEIDLPQDREKGFMAMENTTLRMHWLVSRLTNDRFALEDRDALYLATTERASLRWLVSITQYASDCYQETDGRLVDDNYHLVSPQALRQLKDRAVAELKRAAVDDRLLGQTDLFYLLYRWRDFNDGDSSEVRAWTDSQLNDRAALLVFVRGLTTVAWSAGMSLDGMGDRVSTPIPTVAVRDEMDILDTLSFRNRLEEIAADPASDPAFVIEIRAFLDAWNRTRTGEGEESRGAEAGD